jgi:hypothetical protein
MREIKEYLNKWKDIPYSWILNTQFCKAISFPQIHSQFPSRKTKIQQVYVEIGKLIPNLCGNARGLKYSK